MAIKIVRKQNTNVTWERNALFSAQFDKDKDVFIIPSLLWMYYLYKNFELVEATDENGNELDLSDVKICCGESVKLNVNKNAPVIIENELANNIDLENNETANVNEEE